MRASLRLLPPLLAVAVFVGAMFTAAHGERVRRRGSVGLAPASSEDAAISNVVVNSRGVAISGSAYAQLADDPLLDCDQQKYRVLDVWLRSAGANQMVASKWAGATCVDAGCVVDGAPDRTDEIRIRATGDLDWFFQSTSVFKRTTFDAGSAPQPGARFTIIASYDGTQGTPDNRATLTVCQNGAVVATPQLGSGTIQANLVNSTAPELVGITSNNPEAVVDEVAVGCSALTTAQIAAICATRGQTSTTDFASISGPGPTDGGTPGVSQPPMWLRFEQFSGTTISNSGSMDAGNATLVGGAPTVWGPPSTTLDNTTHIEPDGTETAFAVASRDFDFNQAMTRPQFSWCAYVRPTTALQTNKCLFEKEPGWSWRTQPANGARPIIYIGSGTQNCAYDTTAFTVGTWAHHCFTFDQTQDGGTPTQTNQQASTYYLNGTTLGSENCTATAMVHSGALDPVFVLNSNYVSDAGVSNSCTNAGTYDMDKLLLVRGVLSADQISCIYNGGRINSELSTDFDYITGYDGGCNVPAGNVVAYWTLGETPDQILDAGVGAVLYDRCGTAGYNCYVYDGGPTYDATPKHLTSANYDPEDLATGTP